jgi:anti-anti-sigma factor
VTAVHRLALTGELTIQTAGERRAAFVEMLESADRAAATAVELDLAGVSEIDTAGLQLLLMAQREAAHLGRTLRLTAMSQAVNDVLAIAHLSADLDARLAHVGADSVAGRPAETEENAP